jgi:tetratricopeptide (TPR) repeat protein
VQRLLGAGAVVWFYLSKALLPLNLMFVYPQWNIDPRNILWWLGLLATVLVTGLLVWHRRRSLIRHMLIAWLFFLAALLPVMGFADVYFMKYSLVADHYQYIALVGVLTLAASAFLVISRHWQQPMQIICGAIAVTLLGALSWQLSFMYRDPITLFQTTIDRNPSAWMAHNNLGLVLSDLGEHQEAVAHFQSAIAVNSFEANPHANLAGELGKLGQRAEAIQEYELAEQINPTYAPIHFKFAKELHDDGQWQRALNEYQRTLQINPKYAEAYCNLAAVLIEHGQLNEAIPHLQQAVRLAPNYAEAYNNLGIVQLNLNQPREAIKNFQEALRARTDYTRACSNLALAYAAANQPAEATAAAQKAIELARSQGQTEMAEKIQGWLAKYRSQGRN